MRPQGFQNEAPLSLQLLKGLNERKRFANEENGEWDILQNATFDRSNALTKIDGIRTLLEGFGSPVLNIVQTHDSRKNVIIQCRDAVFMVTEDELFNRIYTPSVFYDAINEEDTMPHAILVHREASSVHGGAVATGWQQRKLTTIVSQINADGTPATFVSLAANQFTLQPGTYRIRGWQACAHVTTGTKMSGALWDVTAGAYAFLGLHNQYGNQYTIRNANENNIIHMAGNLTIAAVNVYELRIFSSASNADRGMGFASASGIDEVYANLEIVKSA